jgi:hypothetical protein
LALAATAYREVTTAQDNANEGIDTLATNEPGHVLDWVMQPISYARHRFPPDIIRHAVWLYSGSR